MTADVQSAVSALWDGWHERLGREAEHAAITRAQAGDRDAALALLKSNAPVIKRYLRRVETTRNAIVPEDAYQVAVVGFMQAVHAYSVERGGDLAPFLYGFLRDALYEWGGQYYVLNVPSRTRKRVDAFLREAGGDFELARKAWEEAGHDPLSFDAARRAVGHDVATVSEADFIEHGFDQIENRILASAALLVLTAAERMAVTLYFGLRDGEQRGKAEVAEIMGVSPATAGRLKASALAKMQQVTATIEETA